MKNLKKLLFLNAKSLNSCFKNSKTGISEGFRGTVSKICLQWHNLKDTSYKEDSHTVHQSFKRFKSQKNCAYCLTIVFLKNIIYVYIVKPTILDYQAKIIYLIKVFGDITS